MKQKLLFIYNNSLDGSYGGSQRTLQAKKGLEGYFELILYSCVKKPNKLCTFFSAILFYCGGLNRNDCKNIVNIIKNNINELAGVYFDVSLYGRLAKKIKKEYPGLPVVINYHNNEKKFLAGRIKNEGFLYIFLYWSVYYNEKLSLQYGDYHIFITKEDKESLMPFKGGWTIVPVTLNDYFDEKKTTSDKKQYPYLLFFGSASSANIEGARFIIEKVVPNIDIKCVIAGKGMKKIFSFNSTKNVEIIDFVEDPCVLFGNATAFISPLFSGSGAKIKVAEALMHGKRILGTPLSFYGYEENENFIVCENAEDFIHNINLLDKEKRFYEESRQLFLEKYSDKNTNNYYMPVKMFLEK